MNQLTLQWNTVTLTWPFTRSYPGSSCAPHKYRDQCSHVHGFHPMQQKPALQEYFWKSNPDLQLEHNNSARPETLAQPWSTKAYSALGYPQVCPPHSATMLAGLSSSVANTLSHCVIFPHLISLLIINYKTTSASPNIHTMVQYLTSLPSSKKAFYWIQHDFRAWSKVSGRRQLRAARKYRKQISYVKTGKKLEESLTEALLLKQVWLLSYI